MYDENQPRKYYKLIKFLLCVNIRKIGYEIEFDLAKVVLRAQVGGKRGGLKVRAPSGFSLFLVKR